MSLIEYVAGAVGIENGKSGPVDVLLTTTVAGGALATTLADEGSVAWALAVLVICAVVMSEEVTVYGPMQASCSPGISDVSGQVIVARLSDTPTPDSVVVPALVIRKPKCTTCPAADTPDVSEDCTTLNEEVAAAGLVAAATRAVGTIAAACRRARPKLRRPIGATGARTAVCRDGRSHSASAPFEDPLTARSVTCDARRFRNYSYTPRGFPAGFPHTQVRLLARSALD